MIYGIMSNAVCNEILIKAINDWPNPIIKLEDYELEVRNFIGGEITKNKLELRLSQIDLSKNAWEAESLSQLINVFQFYKEGASLKDIISNLRIKLED